MKSAVIAIDISKKINVYDYISKIKPLLDNFANYDKVYCLLIDLLVDAGTISLCDKEARVYENMRTLINLGFNEKTTFLLQSNISGLYQLSNELSTHIYISKIIKNDFLITSIQKNSINDIKLSSLINIANIISSIIMVEADDLYASKTFEPLYNFAKKILANYNESNDIKLFLPKIVLNDALTYSNLSADGNAFISDKFDNDLDLCLTGEELKRKINGIYTDPNHIKINDKGSVKNNPLFAFVDAICEDCDVQEFFGLNSIDELKYHYTQGGIGDFKVKSMLYSSFIKKFNICSKEIDEDYLKSRLK